MRRFIFSVGVAGFEPATSCSQSRRDDRATLHPEFSLNRAEFIPHERDYTPKFASDFGGANIGNSTTLVQTKCSFDFLDSISAHR